MTSIRTRYETNKTRRESTPWTIPTGGRLAGLAGSALLLLALSMPVAAAAAPADNLRDYLDTLQALGLPEYAADIEQVAEGMSDVELERFAGPSMQQATAAFRQWIDVENAARAAGVLVPSSKQSPTELRHVVVDAPFPVADFSDLDPCPNPEADFETLFALRAAVIALKDVYIAAKTFDAASKPACFMLFVAIGVGGNVAPACSGFSLLEAAAAVALDIADFSLDRVVQCRDQYDFARGQASHQRTAHIEDQITTHDADMKYKLADHDVRVQDKLREALAIEARIEAKVDIGLKTQLELAMGRKGIKQPAIFYQDRLDELCGVAQEAIDDLPPMYALAELAQSSVTQGTAFKVSDPKRAVTLCTRGFNLATRDSLFPR